ncbi:MAG TPA: hypothetical protein VK675_03395 [Candidatus Paceibacterota bacterium]|nr:hypothetical protein [Candidatus Paceibacterota bacterium]
MNKAQKIDSLVLILLAIIVVPIVLILHVRFLTSAFLFLGVPSIYLILRKTQNLKVIFSGVFLIGIILGFGFDFLETFNKAWLIPEEQLVLPYRIFGVAPVDELICLILWTLLMILVYEHFFERKRKENVDIKHYIFTGIIPASAYLLLIIFAFFFAPHFITFRYAYLIFGTLAFLPVIFCVIKKPRLAWHIVKVAPYFIFLFLIFEFTALYLHQWSFGGQYIGYVDFFSFRFPIEEFIFWIFVSSTITLTDYKLFVDTQE